MGNITSGGPCGDRNKPISVSVSDYFFSNPDESDIPSTPASPTSGLVSVLSVEVTRLTEENRMLLKEIRNRNFADSATLCQERDVLKARLEFLLPQYTILQSQLEVAALEKQEYQFKRAADSTLKLEKDVLTWELTALNKTNSELKSNIEFLGSKRNMMKLAMQDMHANNKEMKKSLSELLTLEEKNTLLIAELAHFREETLAKSTDMTAELTAMRDTNTSLVEALATAKNDIEKLQKGLSSESEALISELKLTQQDKEALTALNETCTIELATIRGEKESLEIMNESIKGELFVLKTDFEAMTLSNKSLRIELDALRKETDELSVSNKNYITELAELGNIKNEFEALRVSHTNVSDDLKRMQSELKTILLERDSLVASNKMLQTKLSTMIAEEQTTVVDDMKGSRTPTPMLVWSKASRPGRQALWNNVLGSPRSPKSPDSPFGA